MKDRFKRNHLSRTLKIDNVYSVFYNNMVRNYASIGESHDFYEFVYVDNGEILVTIDEPLTGPSFKLAQGEGYLHPPDQFHRHSVEDKKTGSAIFISFWCDNSLFEALACRIARIGQKQKEYIAEIMTCASQIFKNILEEDKSFIFIKFNNYNILYEQLLRNNLENLFLDMLIKNDVKETYSNTTNLGLGTEDKLVTEIKSYLLENLYSKITIDGLCQTFSYSKSTISRKFKASTDKTIMQYINELKVTEAIYMIENTDLTITDIALMLNFSSYQYFSRVFKQCTDMYPNHYKKSIARKKNIKYLYKETSS